MCSSVLTKMPSCLEVCKELIDTGEKTTKQHFWLRMNMLEASGQQYKLTLLMTDFLHHFDLPRIAKNELGCYSSCLIQKEPIFRELQLKWTRLILGVGGKR